MKKILVLLHLIVLMACSSEEDVIPYFELSDKNLVYAWKGGVHDVCISTNSMWNITSSLPDWLSANPQSNSCLSFIAEANETSNMRSCIVTFSSEQQSDTLWISQKAKERLAFIGEKSLYLDAGNNEFSVEVDKNVNFELEYLENAGTWLSQAQASQGENSSIGDINILFPTGNKLSFKAEANTTLQERTGQIVIYNQEFELSDTLQVHQSGSLDEYTDGEVVQLQQATDGNVHLVIMGDGFSRKSLKKNGEYQQIMQEATEHFFSIEPFTSYRNFFNVYMVAAESEEEGIETGNAFGFVSNGSKFGSTFGTGTEITCNSDLVFEYARKVKEIPEKEPITVIVVLNNNKYAGTTYLYANGNSIALCPMSTYKSPNDFEGLIHHEACGHGFGFLCDEYVYYDKDMPESRKTNLREWQALGFQMNLDFTDNLSQILWKDFIGIEKYKEVGAYEGGYEYRYGVWRSEQNSCMNNNVPYFNVQSRWSIVKRIMHLSGLNFDIQDFIENDFPIYPTETTTRLAKDFIPLGSPIWIKNIETK